MKPPLFPLLTLLLTLTIPFTNAQPPTNCAASRKLLPPHHFILTEQPDNPNLTTLSTIFTSLNRRVPISILFTTTNRALSNPTTTSSYTRWTFQSGDNTTPKWIPQGISSTADALDKGTYEGHDGWVISWHRDDDKSVRVSFVNRKDNTYRHALLVYPHMEDDFTEVPIHAGGVVWYGDTLWVVDTRRGVRVFDLGNVWEVDVGGGIGKVGEGRYEAREYRFVVPQVRWYKWTGAFPFRFSYISLDRTATPDTLMVGEYQPNTTVPIRMVQYPLDYTTRRLRMDGRVATATWAYCVGIERMQGAVQADGKVYISRSNGASRGDMFGWVPGKIAHNNEGFFPRSPEDLSYDKRGKKLYGLTEHEGQRYIISTDTSKVKSD
ncbi:hypothetical protein B0T14DRAFT_431655 [Immersiella caudata]|uniref:Uncharacterized protein n=1 Tax=Immersiella caudata TaxID=314043 RepID=A0AA40C0W6_9PEZI|nr:hypothetical protein B0T14DRAFT_431655 [Immersiella caudata]